MTSISRNGVVEALKGFNDQYRAQEQKDPKEGYVVQIFDKPNGIETSLIPCGGTRQSKLLSGIKTVKSKCLFCPQSLLGSPQKVNNVAKLKTTNVVKSLSGQLLVVPKGHYAHWFEAPVKVQADLLREAIELRNQYPESKKRPIELHCGSAAGQTFFHIHVRTNIYP